MKSIGTGIQAASFQPRAHLEGINLPSTFKLPTLDRVREDSALLKERKDIGPEAINAVFMTGGKIGHQTMLNEPLTWNMTLTNLFKFAYFTHVHDIPDDLLEDVIWTLKMFVRVLTESTEKELRAIGHYLPNQTAGSASYYMLWNTRGKLAYHLMDPKIDRADEALPYIKAMDKELHKRLRRVKSRQPAWMFDPHFYSLYSDALVLSGNYSEDTKLMLERVVEGTEKYLLVNPDLGPYDYTKTIVKARIHLCLVLQQLGVQPEKQKEHMEYVTKFIKKNPKIMSPAHLRQILKHPGRPINPVYETIGGIEWIEDNVTTARQDNAQSKQCRVCGVREPVKTLFRCSGCRHIYYCSRECQRANWKVHKDACREKAQENKNVEELKASNPKAANKATDWIKWREGTHMANTECLVNALGLHRDPTRGKTHIVFRQVEYTPRVSKDPRYRFRVARCGVFKIESVMADIELMMGLDKGEGVEYIDSLLADLGSTSPGGEKIPMLDLTFGEGVQTWLGSAAVSEDQLRALVYNADWRHEMNLGEPPEPLLLASRVPDAENTF